MLVQNAIKYFVVSLLAVVNFTGLFVVNQLHEETKQHKEPPSTLVVHNYHKPQFNMSYDLNMSYDRELIKAQSNYITHYGIIFKHGDISWLPALASQAGWPEKTWNKLGQIILRESGGCPNRRGGDVVNSDCIIKRVSEWNHRRYRLVTDQWSQL